MVQSHASGPQLAAEGIEGVCPLSAEGRGCVHYTVTAINVSDQDQQPMQF